MKIFRRLLLIAISLFVLITPNLVFAGDNKNPVNIYLFHSHYCPHCGAEREFLSEYEKENENIEVYQYEVRDKDNSRLLQEVAEELDVSAQYIPLTVICGETIIGFNENGSTEQRIKSLVDECFETGCEDPVREILLNKPDDEGRQCSDSSENLEDTENSVTQISDEEMDIPILGKVNLSDYSLPMITVLLGFLDGFNPCAMWVLLYLISMLLGMQDRKKMWFVGITFVVSSAVVYFLFMTSWLNFFLFIGFVKWVRVLIGSVAIASGAIHLKDYWDTRPGCKVTDVEKRKKIQYRINQIVSDKCFWMVIVGIVAMAFSVNLIELVCSAGFPAIYTHMLSLSDLSTLQYYSYLLLYVFVFMIDDLAIFFIAMITLHATGIRTKYKRVSSLVGGILILLIGILLIFKPEVLMFS